MTEPNVEQTPTRTIQRLTHSRMSCAKTCLRQHYYRYELGLRRVRDAKPLRMGRAVHLGIALWASGTPNDDAILAATADYESMPPWAATAEQEHDWLTEREIVAALLAGYFWYYKNDPFEVVEVEAKFEMPLVNPDTGAASRTFVLAGRRDGIVRRNGRLSVRETKTSGDDISPDSDFWRRLRCDQQISLYMLSARAAGHDVADVLYDVIRKPTIAPRQVPILDGDGNKIVLDADGNRVYTAAGKPRQTSDTKLGYVLQSRIETPMEFGDRLLADITGRPEYYYQRREIPRLEADLDEFRYECWQQADLIRACENRGLWFRNVSRFTCSNCEYADICLQSVTVDVATPPTGFEIVEDVHPELSED
jgi:hypothetical protein